MKAKAAVLFSGGKDSCLALHKAIKKGLKISVLLSIIPDNMDSMMFHTPDLMLLEKQAEMLGVDLITRKIRARNESEELDDMRALLADAKKKYKFDTIVVGGIASSYQGNRINNLANELELEVFAPLWNYNAEQLWQELLDERFEVVITKIACEGIPKDFIGRIITREEFEKLRKLGEKYKFRLDFEGGEAETAVLWMPEFSKEIKIDFDVYSEDKYRHFIKITRII
jgi:ABC transporter with metal-binding/Fe-S-binding domain ATP-binding protein